MSLVGLFNALKFLTNQKGSPLIVLVIYKYEQPETLQRSVLSKYLSESETYSIIFPKMTKLAIFTFGCLVVTCIVLIAHAADEKYSSKYDNIDVDVILANSRLRNQYVNCVIGTSPCRTGAARFLKENFAEAYVTSCKKCTDKQFYFFTAVTEWFTKKEPDTWNRMVEVAIKDLQKKNG